MDSKPHITEKNIWDLEIEMNCYNEIGYNNLSIDQKNRQIWLNYHVPKWKQETENNKSKESNYVKIKRKNSSIRGAKGRERNPVRFRRLGGRFGRVYPGNTARDRKKEKKEREDTVELKVDGEDLMAVLNRTRRRH